MGPWRKFFSHPSFSYLLFFATSPMKLKLANKWESTNSKPPGPIITIGQLETRTSSQIQFITLFLWQVHTLAAPFTSLSNPCKYAWPKPISWAKPACSDFSSWNSIMGAAGSHAELSTAGEQSPPHHTCKHPFSLNLAARERESCSAPVLMSILQ